MVAPAEISQRCAWAVQLLQALRAYEIDMGHIVEADAALATRQLSRLEELMHRDTEEDAVDLETRSDAIFSRVVSRLGHEGFSFVEIAAFVNSVVTPGARLAYCSAAEVEDSMVESPPAGSVDSAETNQFL